MTKTKMQADALTSEERDTFIAFEQAFDDMSRIAQEDACKAGWWDTERNDGEMLALIHSEVSEMLEALRKPEADSEKILDYTHLEEEAADVLIRLMDFAAARDLDLAGATIAKLLYNRTRPRKHNKKF